MSPVSAPAAPRTAVYIVGTVCSAITGRALPGPTVAVDLLEQSCADGHQPWRCGGRAVADGQGHYGVALYDPGDYGFVVHAAGHQPAAGTVHAALPGVVTRDWRLVPAA